MIDTEIEGKIVDVVNEEIFEGSVLIENGDIKEIEKKENDPDRFLLPGLVDSHIHIESTMLPPSKFSRVAVKHGTVSTVSDPHEIANVLGVEGVEFMIEDGKEVPLKFYFGAPSCVPPTPYATSGAKVDVDDIEQLFEEKGCAFLGEVMDFLGVVDRDPEMMEKISIAKKNDVRMDGHAPGLRGDELTEYISAGITTDHEVTNFQEAVEKLEKGMKIQIREGSAASSFDELIELVEEYPEKTMLCSDDLHIHDLTEGHIDRLVRKAFQEDIDLMKVLKAACVNPVEHYGLDVGLLRKGDPADFIVVDVLEEFEVERTYIDGNVVYEKGEENTLSQHETDIINNFKAKKQDISDFKIENKGGAIRVMGVNDKDLITKEMIEEPKVKDGEVVSDMEKDILKLAVLNRYEENSGPALGFVNNFGLDEGALACSVLHDTHNLIAVGTDDESICRAMNLIIENKGGVCAVSKDEEKILPLPIAGLMSDLSIEKVEKIYLELKEDAKELGCDITAPFMTLSFLSLLVIPKLKLSDQSLFDVEESEFVDIFVE